MTISISPRLVALALVCATFGSAYFYHHRETPIISVATSAEAKAPVTDKRIAFSFDDVPRGPGAFLEAGARTGLLLKALKAGGITQAVFFVNPGRISPSDNDAATVAAYGKAGHLLANHGQTHLALSKVPAAIFLADIDKAEDWLKQQPNHRPWFRFPFLDEGQRDHAKRDAVRAGLKARGLLNAYVTVDASDWRMEQSAIDAAQAGQVMDWNALRDLFVESYVQSVDFSDRLARRTLGRAPVQVILLHETDLAAMFVDDLAAALRKDGWQIVSADAAFADPIAATEPDIPFADGTRTQMLATEKGISGPRWYERNDPAIAKKLFAERVLHE